MPGTDAARWLMVGTLAALMTIAVGRVSAQRITPAKEAAIRRLLELTDARQHEVDYGREIGAELVAILKRNLPPTENAEEVGGHLTKQLITRLDSDELINRLIPVYDKAFTEEEIRRINQFYESPPGRRLREVMPTLRSDSTEVTERWIKELVPEIMSQIR